MKFMRKGLRMNFILLYITLIIPKFKDAAQKIRVQQVGETYNL